MSADRIGDLWAQASASVEREDWSGALRVFEELLSAQPDDPRVLYNKALVHLEMHDSQTAGEHLRRAVEIDPDYALAQAELAQIDAPDAVPTPQPPSQPPVPHTPPTAPIGDVRALLAEDLPLAEMNLKAGLAIWVILGALMAMFWSVRQDNGPVVAFAALAIVFGIEMSKGFIDVVFIFICLRIEIAYERCPFVRVEFHHFLLLRVANDDHTPTHLAIHFATSKCDSFERLSYMGILARSVVVVSHVAKAERFGVIGRCVGREAAYPNRRHYRRRHTAAGQHEREPPPNYWQRFRLGTQHRCPCTSNGLFRFGFVNG